MLTKPSTKLQAQNSTDTKTGRLHMDSSRQAYELQCIHLDQEQASKLLFKTKNKKENKRIFLLIICNVFLENFMRLS